MKVLYPFLIMILFFSCSNQLDTPLPEDLEMGDYTVLAKHLTPRAEKLMKKSFVKGVSISVVDGQETVWEAGFGLADVKTKVAVDENTVFRYGSVTKLFTTVAILDLVEQGLIDLEAPIQSYIPEIRIQSHAAELDTIRIRHLLTHHSGLHGDYLDNFMFYKPLDSEYDKWYKDMPELLSHEYVQLGTDSLFSYCNNAFTLLGVIIQRVTGMEYPDYMQEEIFKPLGMEHTSVVMTPQLEVITAKGYQMNREMDMPYIRDLPAGSLLSNSRDMTAFMKMLFNQGITITGDTLLDAATVADIFEVKNAHVPLDKNFRIGWTFWLLNPYDKEFIQSPAGHGGDLPPYHAIFFMLPGEQLAVSAVTNSNTGAGVVMELAMDAMKLAYEIKTGSEIDYRPHAPEKDFVAADYLVYEGYYLSPMGLIFLDVTNKDLRFKLGPATISLTPCIDDWFSLKLKLFGLIPAGADAMSNLRVSLFQHAGLSYMELVMNGVSAGVTSRIEPVEIPAVWLNRVGNYERLNLDKPFTKQQLPFTLDKPVLRMDKKSGLLLLEGNLLGSKTQLPLRPLNDNMAVVQGIGRMAGQTVQVIHNEDGEVLKWSGLILKRR